MPVRLRRTLVTSVLLAASTAAAAAQTPPSEPPKRIEDNSFLIEEAYNQERGIVQHISTFAHASRGRGWAYSFTQEWPAPTITNQLSYTLNVVQPDGPGAGPKFGDLLLNYRRQVVDGENLLFAPRLTAVLPTGDAESGSGYGGVGVQANLPLTWLPFAHLATHTNVGGTFVPSAKAPSGERTRVANLLLGESLIYLMRPNFNLMLESTWSATSTRPKDIPGADAQVERMLTLSPGFRFSIDFASGLQIVPGLAVPFTITGSPGDFATETGVFVYLSFEHPFRKQ